MAHENATPRPWSFDAENTKILGSDAQVTRVCDITGSPSNPTVLADGNLIVEAVNSYDTLRAEVSRLRAEVSRLRVEAAPLEAQIDHWQRKFDGVVDLYAQASEAVKQEAAENDTLRAEVARLEAENAREPRWQAIDTAPEGDGELLVFCADTGEMFVAFRTSPRSDLWTYARSLHGNEICCRPTHWSHLPERPA